MKNYDGGVVLDFKKIFNSYSGLPKEIYVLFLGRIVNSIGAFVHPLMTLILTQKIGMSNSEAGIMVTTLAICQVPCLILGGKLADTIGRRKVIIIFQSLGALTLISCGFMTPSITMAKLMILSSCLYSLSTPAYDALNADLTNSQNRKTSYSLLYMGANIGFAIGPVIGGALYKDYLSWIFIGDAITTLISLTLFIIFIKETMTKKEEIKENNEVIESNLESHEKGSVINVLLRRPILIIFSVIMLMYQFGYSQFGFTLPLQLGELFGDNGARLFGLLGGFNGAVVIILTPVLTVFTKNLNSIKSMAIGGALYAISFALFGFAGTIPVFYLAMFLMTTGEVFICINQGAFIASKTPASHRGRISSILPLISGAGYAFGPMIMGQFIDNYGIFRSWMFIFMIVGIGAFSMFMLEINEKKKVEDKQFKSILK